MKEEKYKDFLSKIVNVTEEPRPSANSEDLHNKEIWIRTKGENSIFFHNKTKLKYEIDKPLMDEMRKFTRIFKQANKNRDNGYKVNQLIKRKLDKIAIIYQLKNKDTKEKYIGYTTYPLLTFIKLQIHKRNSREESVFDHLNDEFIQYNPMDFSFKALEFVKYNTKKDLMERKGKCVNYYADLKLEPESETKNMILELDKDCITETTFDKRIEIFYDALEKGGSSQAKNFFKPFTGYIYEIHNILNNKKFIGGYDKKMTKKKIFDHILKNKKNKELILDIMRIGADNFKTRVIDEYESYTPYDFMFRIDYHKIRNSCLDKDKGYNKSYCISYSEDLLGKNLSSKKRDQLERTFFLVLHKMIFQRYFNDPLVYTDIYGFLYSIRNKKDGKMYFGKVYSKTLYDVIKDHYNKALEGNVKHSQILKAFSEVPFHNFEFKIVKIKGNDDNDIDLAEEMYNHIEKFDTVNNGYNIDTKTLSKNIFWSKKKN